MRYSTELSTMPASFCTVPSSATQHIREVFGRQDGFSSCAIVGTSGYMLNARLGSEIDEKEMVVRTNLAPVGGFEEVVGSKTTLRVMNTEALKCVLLERACSRLKAGDSSFCPSYHIHVNSMVNAWQLRSSMSHGCPGSNLSETSLLPEHDPTIQHFKSRTGGNIMTGAWAIAIAMHLCPNGVDVYGFTHAGNLWLTQYAQYHYYEYNRANKVDKLSDAAQALTALAEQQPNCVRLNTPTVLVPELPCSISRPIVDPFVDGVPHRFSASTYWNAQTPSLAQPVRSCPSLPPSPSGPVHSCTPCPALPSNWMSNYDGAEGCDEAMNYYCWTSAGCIIPEFKDCTGSPPLVARRSGGRATNDIEWRCYSYSALKPNGLDHNGASSSYCTRNEQLQTVLAECKLARLPRLPPALQPPPSLPLPTMPLSFPPQLPPALQPPPQMMPLPPQMIPPRIMPPPLSPPQLPSVPPHLGPFLAMLAPSPLPPQLPSKLPLLAPSLAIIAIIVMLAVLAILTRYWILKLWPAVPAPASPHTANIRVERRAPIRKAPIRKAPNLKAPNRKARRKVADEAPRRSREPKTATCKSSANFVWLESTEDEFIEL